MIHASPATAQMSDSIRIHTRFPFLPAALPKRLSASVRFCDTGDSEQRYGNFKPMPQPDAEFTNSSTNFRYSDSIEPFAARSRFFWEGKAIPGWREPLRLLYDTELVIVSEGSFLLEIEGRAEKMASGAIALVPPSTWHQSWVETGQCAVRRCVHFTWNSDGYRGDPPLMCMRGEPFHKSLVQSVPVALNYFLPLIAGPDETRGLLPVIHLLLDEMRTNGPNSDLLLTALVRGLLERKTDQAGKYPLQGKTGRAVLAVKNMIDTRYADPLHYSDFCQLVDWSPGHLCQAFSALIGVAPKEYLNLVRIEHAKRLLQDPHRNMSQIARAVGVPDPNYFARLFKSKVRLSPTEFIKSAVNPPDSE
jgi:AraC-like DNA-binding protein/quercetin dioxygenase-like cupin family protein